LLIPEDPGNCGIYAPENSGSLVEEFSSLDAVIVAERGRVSFQGNKFLETRDAQGNEQQQQFRADHGYQELTGAIRSTFLEPHMILQLVRNVQKAHYPTLFWLVDNGVKVFYEYVEVPMGLR
jgi:hypothetical protein